MTRRLLLVPVVAGPIAAVAWFTGYAWPIITTTWSVLAPREETKDTELDRLA